MPVLGRTRSLDWQAPTLTPLPERRGLGMRWLSSLQIDFSLPQVQFSTLTDRLRPFGANLLSYRRQQLYLRGDDHEKIANARREAEALFTSKPIRGHLSAAPPNAGQPESYAFAFLEAPNRAQAAARNT